VIYLSVCLFTYILSQALLRDYLTGKGLWASPEDLPAPPSSFEINLFIEDN